MADSRLSAAEYRRQQGLPPPGADRAPKNLRMRIETETQLQIAVANWFRALTALDALPLHVPNGEKRDRFFGARLQAMGVLPGAPDWAVPTAGNRTLWLELKIPGGSLRPEQRAFRDRVTAWGHTYAVCRSIEDVHQELQRAGVAVVESPLAKAMREAT